MRKITPILTTVLLLGMQLLAQVEPDAGKWKTWIISSGKDYRLPAPGSYKDEVAQVLAKQKDLNAETKQQIVFWSAGAPSYRWEDMMGKMWTVDTGYYGALANMLLNVANYDATIAAWDTKYAYNRARPFAADKRIKLLTMNPQSPSYPCERSVSAGVAVAIFSKFYPAMADSVKRMAQRCMDAQIASGAAFPSDTRAGFELGKRIAEEEIERTKNFIRYTSWDGKMPQGPAYWRGKSPMFPMAGKNQTFVLDSASQYRPGPPPDFAKDMAELKAFKQTFRSQANAFYYASQYSADDLLSKKIFEYNLNTNAPRAARIYAATAITYYDAFLACFDAKYAYWGIRPDQYDTTYKSIVPTPPFPGYPSGHAVMVGAQDALFSYFFPADRALFQRNAKNGAESRFQAGIHFRTDNDTGLDLGRKVANAVVMRLKKDGAD